MRLTFIGILILLIGCQNPKTNSGTDNNNSANTYRNPKEFIPEKVKEYVKNHLPGWMFPDTSDYVKSWWSFYSKDQNPYFAATDLNDDNKTDYGFLLKNENSIIVVILIDSANTYMLNILDKFSQTQTEKVKNLTFGVSIEPPGHTDCVVNGQEQSLVLRSNGLVLNNYEFKYRIYYWAGGNINVFQVADKVIN